jgi:hypothetical protein
MATIEIDDETVRVRLSTWERLAGLRGDVVVPREAIRSCEVLDQPFSARQGLRAPGTGFPGVIAYGTYRHSGSKDFLALLRGQRAVRLTLANQTFSALLIGTPDPEEVCSRLGR